jgi:hypothetical protein
MLPANEPWSLLWSSWLRQTFASRLSPHYLFDGIDINNVDSWKLATVQNKGKACNVTNCGPPDSANQKGYLGPVEWLEELHKQKWGDYFVVVGCERESPDEDSMDDESLEGLETVEYGAGVIEDKEDIHGMQDQANIGDAAHNLSNSFSPGVLLSNGEFYAHSPRSIASSLPSLVIQPRKPPTQLSALSRAKAARSYSWDIMSYDFEDLNEYRFPTAPMCTQVGTVNITDLITPSTSSLSMLVLHGQLRGLDSGQSSFLLSPESTVESLDLVDFKYSFTFQIWEQYCSLLETCLGGKVKRAGGDLSNPDIAKYIALMKRVSCQDLKHPKA